MKIKEVIFVLIIIAGFCKAQTLIYTPSKTYSANITNSDQLLAPISFKNNTTSVFNLMYKNYNYNFPAGWTVGVCDTYNCLGGITWGNWSLDSLNPGEEYYIQLSVNPNNIEGNGYLEVHMWRTNAAWLVDTLRWYLNAKTVGLQEISIQNNNRIFPNPVKDILHFNTSETIDAVRIEDALGRPLMEITSVGEQLNISYLESGYYTLFFENKGRMYYKKIVKE